MKTKFKRTDSNKYKFKGKWRKPRGIHNKLRLKKKGHQKTPAVGYASPKKEKGLTKQGLKPFLISSIKDLEKIDKKTNIGVISSSLGTKKRLDLLEKAKGLGIKFQGIKDVGGFIEKKKAELEARKKKTKQREEKKKKTKEEALKKAEEKKEEDKSEKVEKEKTRILESKQKQVDTPKDIKPKVDTTSQKAGHIQSSVPGTKQ